MRFVVSILLLLAQLRPLGGALVCLEETTSGPECAMPEHGAALTQPSTDAPSLLHGCRHPALCSPAGLSLPRTAVRVGVEAPPTSFEPAFALASPRAPALAPPFHPPRL